MELHRHIINSNSRTIKLRPFGDLQLGEPGFRSDLWDRFKKELTDDKDAYAIGLGDYSNSFRPTIQRELEKAFIKDNQAHKEFDTIMSRSIVDLAEELKPFKDRIIGLCEGHHFHKYLDGTTTTQHLCQLLQVKYLGFVAMIQLITRRCGTDARTINIYATHGCGGARHSHSDLGKLEREIMPFFDADVYLRGHSTKVYVVPGHPLSRLSSNHGEPLRLVQKQRWLVNTGGFMQGYVQGHTSYVEQTNLPPCALGWGIVTLHFAHQHIEISASVETPPETDLTQLKPHKRKRHK